MRITALLVAPLPLLLIGCNPYEKRSGEYYAGPVDPAAFPAAYLGAGGSAKMSGGTFTPAKLYSKGNLAGSFLFALSALQSGADDPLAITLNGSAASFTTPIAYVFDPTGTSPFPASAQCQTPSGYVYDQRTDGYRLDTQGNIFTALPTSSYSPIVAEVPVRSGGESCNDIKSEITLVKRSDVSLSATPADPTIPNSHAVGIPDGKYLAWALIDPGATVNFQNGMTDDATNLGPAKLGWYDHYMTAYVDGGYIPTETVKMGMDTVLRMKTRSLYSPNMIPTTTPSGPGVGPGKVGAGYDVVDAVRGDAGYSPICAVFSYAPADPMNPPKSVDQIDPTKAVAKGYVWCLQPEAK